MVKTISAAIIAFLITTGSVGVQAGDFDRNTVFDRINFQSVLDANRTASTGKASPQIEDTKESYKKRRGKAFLKSILIPGWGQISTGRKHTGYAFLTAEALLISSVIGAQMYASWLEDDYIAFAKQHAGVRGDKEHQYYVDIGNWLDRRSYNERRLQDRNYEALYTDPRYDWTWDADASRAYFKDLRIKSDSAGQISVMLIGGLLLNHLASAVDASRGVKKDETISVNTDYRSTIKVSLVFYR